MSDDVVATGAERLVSAAGVAGSLVFGLMLLFGAAIGFLFRHRSL